MPEQSELPQQQGKQEIIIENGRKEQTYMICKRLTSNERPTFPKRAIITAGMPYGNKNLHFGHVGGMFIHADIFARFLRDRIGKENVIFLSGTDCFYACKIMAILIHKNMQLYNKDWTIREGGIG